MVVQAVSFVLGSVFLFSFSELPALWMCGVAGCFALVVYRRCSPLTWFIIGYLLAAWHAHTMIGSRLDSRWLDREISVTGVVSGLPVQDDNKTRFLFALERMCGIDAGDIEPDVSHTGGIDTGTCEDVVGTRLRISWYRDAPLLRAGQRWRLTVKLREPHGFMNPGGFDYEKWLFQQRIVATGYVRDSDSAVALSLVRGPLQLMQSVRGWLKQRLDAALTDRHHSGLIMAIAIGDRSGIARLQWQQFIATGTNHLLAISGLHISLVAAFAAMIASVLWGRLALLHRVSRSAFVMVTGFTAALFYAGMAGFAVPTQRALLMFGVVALLSLIARHQNRQRGLLLALALVCAIDPLVVLSAGFWMSFAAVAILFVVYSFVQREGRRHRLSTLLRGHLLITIGLYPFGIYFFGHMSLVSPLANFVAVPLVGLLLTPAIFVASLLAMVSVSLARVVLLPVDWLLSVVTAYLQIISNWQYAQTYISFGNHSVLLWSAMIAVLFLLPFNWRLRWLAVMAALPLLLAGGTAPGVGHYRVTFLDVGQGTAIVVQTHRHVMVYDTGAKFSESFNAADAVILPFLRAAGIDRIDRLVISHADGDHSGGAMALIAGIEVREVTVSAPIDGISAGLCRAGQSLLWDEVTFEVLHPGERDTGSKNDRSCVVLITGADNTRTLLPGDIEALGERRLLERGLPAVDILLAPHHGSATSSSRAFVRATKAQYVVHTTGYRNRYGFPHRQVADEYRRAGAMQFNTALSGAITFHVTGKQGIEVSAYRPQQRAIWH